MGHGGAVPISSCLVLQNPGKSRNGRHQQYFGGRLPHYRVRVVYDVEYGETMKCGPPPCFPPAAEASGFHDVRGRQIFIRYLAHGSTMAESLLHETAHAAAGGEHNEAFDAEMQRLAEVGAPVFHLDLEQ